MKKGLSIFTLLISLLVLSQNPGGVSGSDIWYKTTDETIGNTGNTFVDSSVQNREIIEDSQTPFTETTLFNYNPSLNFTGSQSLYWQYPLENLSTATIFVVYQLENGETAYALFNSKWLEGVEDNLPPDTDNERAFQYSTQLVSKEDITLEYPTDELSEYFPDKTPFINTLLWFDFNSKNIHNSYGVTGESKIQMGKSYNNGQQLVPNLVGKMPEFIIYNSALNKNDRLRIESYLAIKYGITLQPEVNYVNSLNEIIWHQENNTLFGKRIFGIGRDNNSALYQKQSATSHEDLPTLEFGAETIEESNNENNTIINDKNFLTIGDNDASVILQEEANSMNLRLLERIWLIERSGTSINQLNTQITLNNPDIIGEVSDDETLWLIKDPEADNLSISEFLPTNINLEYYAMSSSDDIAAIFEEIIWDTESSDFDQFTFAVGPKMIINAIPRDMDCEATSTHVDVRIRGGNPDYTLDLFSEEGYSLTIDQWNNDEIVLYSLPVGNYTLTVTDDDGYSESVEFEVSGNYGIELDLGEDLTIVTGQEIILDASNGVTISDVTYQWYKDDELLDGEINPTITITEPGTYRVEITNNSNGCVSSDEIVIIVLDPGEVEPIDNPRITIYPNPTSVGSEFTILVELIENSDVLIEIYDFAGALIDSEQFTGQSTYQINKKINSSGSYSIKVITNEVVTTKKILIN